MLVRNLFEQLSIAMIFYRDVDCCGLITNGLRGEDGRVLEKPEGFLKTLKRRGLFLKAHKKKEYRCTPTLLTLNLIL